MKMIICGLVGLILYGLIGLCFGLVLGAILDHEHRIF